MSERIFPRSPREVMDGWVYLPRFIDKIRLRLAGRLHDDYQANFAHKGFDAKWVAASGLKAEDFIAVVKGTVIDGEVFDWVRVNVKKTPAEKSAFNQSILAHGTETGPDRAAVRERLQLRKDQAGLGHRADLLTFVDYIDADEKRL